MFKLIIQKATLCTLFLCYSFEVDYIVFISYIDKRRLSKLSGLAFYFTKQFLNCLLGVIMEQYNNPI